MSPIPKRQAEKIQQVYRERMENPYLMSDKIKNSFVGTNCDLEEDRGLSTNNHGKDHWKICLDETKKKLTVSLFDSIKVNDKKQDDSLTYNAMITSLQQNGLFPTARKRSASTLEFKEGFGPVPPKVPLLKTRVSIPTNVETIAASGKDRNLKSILMKPSVIGQTAERCNHNMGTIIADRKFDTNVTSFSNVPGSESYRNVLTNATISGSLSINSSRSAPSLAIIPNKRVSDSMSNRTSNLDVLKANHFKEAPSTYCPSNSVKEGPDSDIKNFASDRSDKSYLEPTHSRAVENSIANLHWAANQDNHGPDNRVRFNRTDGIISTKFEARLSADLMNLSPTNLKHSPIFIPKPTINNVPTGKTSVQRDKILVRMSSTELTPEPAIKGGSLRVSPTICDRTLSNPRKNSREPQLSSVSSSPTILPKISQVFSISSVGLQVVNVEKPEIQNHHTDHSSTIENANLNSHADESNQKVVNNLANSPDAKCSFNEHQQNKEIFRQEIIGHDRVMPLNYLTSTSNLPINPVQESQRNHLDMCAKIPVLNNTGNYSDHAGKNYIVYAQSMQRNPHMNFYQADFRLFQGQVPVTAMGNIYGQQGFLMNENKIPQAPLESSQMPIRSNNRCRLPKNAHIQIKRVYSQMLKEKKLPEISRFQTDIEFGDSPESQEYKINEQNIGSSSVVPNETSSEDVNKQVELALPAKALSPEDINKQVEMALPTEALSPEDTDRQAELAVPTQALSPGDKSRQAELAAPTEPMSPENLNKQIELALRKASEIDEPTALCLLFKDDQQLKTKQSLQNNPNEIPSNNNQEQNKNHSGTHAPCGTEDEIDPNFNIAGEKDQQSISTGIVKGQPNQDLDSEENRVASVAEQSSHKTVITEEQLPEHNKPSNIATVSSTVQKATGKLDDYFDQKILYVV